MGNCKCYSTHTKKSVFVDNERLCDDMNRNFYLRWRERGIYADSSIEEGMNKVKHNSAYDIISIEKLL